MKLKYVLFFLSLFGIMGFEPFAVFNYYPNSEKFGTSAWLNREMHIIQSQAGNIDENVLRLSLFAYLKARYAGLDNKNILTIIDYSKPSSMKRLFVVNMRTGKVLFNTWVCHGKNSGLLRATSFSNLPGSLKSSIGVFYTENSYFGNNGYSLRLVGLERGINDNAYRRCLVFHGAWYASPYVVRHYGQLGRSWGCPAVSEELARPLIDTIKEHTLVFVYSRDHKWLNNSAFLTG